MPSRRPRLFFSGSPVTTWSYNADSETQTHRLGHALGHFADTGLVVAIAGELGAGKTLFVRGVVDGLGGSPRDVSSPTFVLLQHYDARLPVHHADAYRLRSENEFLDLGTDDWLGHGITLIEWADRISGCLPADHLDLAITVTGETSRQLQFTANGTATAKLVDRLAELFQPIIDRSQ
ncbi:MAG: tRNA (adenosine(37)-N6)-threonylcarbamoyltransferase complex ATPase subunit type 1 TsaE [Planctomycetaceae bacterium]